MSARKILTSAIMGVVFLGFFTGKAWAQVKINEFYSWETSGDWVELYSSEDVDISGWILRDMASSVVKTFPAGTLIGPGSSQFYIVEAGKRLNKDGDLIKLYQEDDATLVDQVNYGDEGGVCTPSAGQTAGRLPDGSSGVTRFASETKGASNTAAEEPCPSPTPSPSPSPTPTQEPDPSPEDNPTPQPSPVVSSSPKTTTTVTTGGTTGGGLFDSHDSEEMLLSTEGGEILGMTEPEASEATETKKEKNPFLISVILAVLGLGLVGGTGVVFYKQRRYNETHEESGET